MGVNQVSCIHHMAIVKLLTFLPWPDVMYCRRSCRAVRLSIVRDETKDAGVISVGGEAVLSGLGHVAMVIFSEEQLFITGTVA